MVEASGHVGGDWRRISLGPRLCLYQTEGAKFKTCSLRVYLHAPLAPETVTATALVPYLLGRGCRGYPDLTAIQRHTEDLYGASVGAGVAKAGEVQSLFLGLDVVHDRYLPEGAAVLEAAVDLLGRMCLEPALQADGTFPSGTVAQEKDNLDRRIRGIMNDKTRYAALRCVQEMCRGEAYALSAIGRLEDLPGLQPTDLTQRWQAVVASAPVEVFAVGGGEALPGLIATALAPLCSGTAAFPHTAPGPHPQTVKRIVEQDDVSQAKLCLGYRAPVVRTDPRYAAMLMYNGILGGFPHSKLFRNVREKAGLAYYAGSQWDATKGVLLISSGIESARYEEALEIIRRQVADIAAGEVTDDEMEFTRRGLANRIRAGLDSPYAMIETAVDQSLCGGLRSAADRLTEVARVTREQVVAVSQTIALDTVYFLTTDRPGLGMTPASAIVAGGGATA